MSSTYTGVATNVSLGSSAQVTVPSDGDALAASSVNTPLDKLADYIEALRGGRAWNFSTFRKIDQAVSAGTYTYLAFGTLTNYDCGLAAVTVTVDTGLLAAGTIKVLFNKAGSYRLTIGYGCALSTTEEYAWRCYKNNTGSFGVPGADANYRTTSTSTFVFRNFGDFVVTGMAVNDYVAFQGNTATSLIINKGTANDVNASLYVERLYP